MVAKMNDNVRLSRPVWGDRGVSKLSTPGHVYFIQGEHGGLIKIGWATCPRTRMARMQAHGPIKLVLLHSEPGNGKEEAALHAKFKTDRQYGEWFSPSIALLTEISDRRARSAGKVYKPGAPPLEPLAPPFWKHEAPKPQPASADPYWEPGNAGWDRLVEAAKALDTPPYRR